MERTPYKTNYVQTLPSVGNKCPNCNGFIESGKFEGSVICRECKSAWKISKYGPKSGGEKEDTGLQILHEVMTQGFKELNERFDGMAEWMAKHLKK